MAGPPASVKDLCLQIISFKLWLPHQSLNMVAAKTRLSRMVRHTERYGPSHPEQGTRSAHRLQGSQPAKRAVLPPPPQYRQNMLEYRGPLPRV